MKIKLAIAEDSFRFRKAFLLLMRQEKDFEFVIEAENGADLLLQLEMVIPDIILLDIRMPVMNGFEAATEIQRKYPAVKIAAFTQFDLEENIIEMSKIGIKSFLNKDQVEDVPRILRIIYKGGLYFPDKVAGIFQRYLKRIPTSISTCPFKLNEIELVLLESICKGWSSSRIAGIINKSARTVEKYRNQLYRKFKVENKEQLIVEAYKWSIIK